MKNLQTGIMKAYILVDEKKPIFAFCQSRVSDICLCRPIDKNVDKTLYINTTMTFLLTLNEIQLVTSNSYLENGTNNHKYIIYEEM